MNAFTPIVPVVELGKVDPKLAFLARAAARFELVHTGEMNIDEAFAGLVVGLSCACDRELIDRWERDFPRLAPQRRVIRAPAAPQSTFDALVFELRTHGLPQLNKTSCRLRLGQLSTQQVRELIAALVRLRPRYLAITEELILKLGDFL
jgi:hypothetical protein